MKFFDNGEYEINAHTMALLPALNMEYATRVLDAVLGEIYVREPILQLLKMACLEGGSSFEGRRKYTEYHLGITQKVPIAVSPLENIYVFPTVSAKQPNCVWLFASHIQSTDTSGKLGKVIFRNGFILELDITPLILQRQIQKVALLYQHFTMRRV